MHSLHILLFLAAGFAAHLSETGQTNSSSAAQPSINQEALAAYSAGTAAATNNDLKTAEAQFAKFVGLEPQIEEGHSALGAVLMRLGKLPQAITELEKARELKPGDISAHINLALAYEQTGANKKALVLFREVEAEVRQKPAADSSHGLPSYVLEAYARSLAATGQLPAATSKMKAAVAESSQNAELHDALGTLYAQQRRWSAAASEFKEAVRLQPRFAAAHLHLGAALAAQQQVLAAIQELNLASAQAPESAVAATELGKAYVANNEDDEAVAEFQRAIRLDSAYMDAKYQLAELLQRTGNNPDAVPLLRQVVAAEPDNAEAGASLGLALLLAGNAKDAIPLLKRKLEQRP
ncbi:MAG: tetratricopeptide repeat protein, partial [Candidatus Acidiferrum sp.]